MSSNGASSGALAVCVLEEDGGGLGFVSKDTIEEQCRASGTPVAYALCLAARVGKGGAESMFPCSIHVFTHTHTHTNQGVSGLRRAVKDAAALLSAAGDGPNLLALGCG